MEHIFAESPAMSAAAGRKVPQVYNPLHQNLPAAQFLRCAIRAVTRRRAGLYSGGFVVLRLHHE